MNVPEDLLYTENDEWLRVDGDTATVGITDYAQDQLSDIVYLEVSSSVGDSIKQGDLFGTVESVKAAADLYLPISGELLEVNEELSGEPELINGDPYGKAWMVKIKLSDPSQKEGLMDAGAYKKFLEERD